MSIMTNYFNNIDFNIASNYYLHTLLKLNYLHKELSNLALYVYNNYNLFYSTTYFLSAITFNIIAYIKNKHNYNKYQLLTNNNKRFVENEIYKTNKGIYNYVTANYIYTNTGAIDLLRYILLKFPEDEALELLGLFEKKIPYMIRDEEKKYGNNEHYIYAKDSRFFLVNEIDSNGKTAIEYVNNSMRILRLLHLKFNTNLERHSFFQNCNFHKLHIIFYTDERRESLFGKYLRNEKNIKVRNKFGETPFMYHLWYVEKHSDSIEKFHTQINHTKMKYGELEMRTIFNNNTRYISPLLIIYNTKKI